MVRVWVAGKNCVIPLLHTGRVWLLVAVLHYRCCVVEWFDLTIIKAAYYLLLLVMPSQSYANSMIYTSFPSDICLYKHHEHDSYILEQIATHVLTLFCILSWVKTVYLIWFKSCTSTTSIRLVNIPSIKLHNTGKNTSSLTFPQSLSNSRTFAGTPGWWLRMHITGRNC